jgi:hypothetical protein
MYIESDRFCHLPKIKQFEEPIANKSKHKFETVWAKQLLIRT